MSSLTVEEIQKSLSNSMMSMQIQMEAERESYKKKITALEKTNKEYKDKIDELTELMASKKNENEVFNKLIADLNSQIRKKEKELESKVEEHKKDSAEISNLNNQIQLKNQNIIQLQMEKKQLGEDFDKRCTLSQHELLVMQKKVENINEDKQALQKELEEKKKIIEEKDNNIEELKQKIAKIEENNKSLLTYVKEMKEKEEIFKKEKEEMLEEKEKFKQEMMNIKSNQAKIEKQKQVIEKEKAEIIKQERRDSKSKILLFEGQDKIITDLLCEFLLKLNNTQYYISVFDLLNKSCKQYEELKFFNKLNASLRESMNDVLFNFFDSARSYFSIAQEKATLNDFLVQKSFKLAQIEKEDIDIIKKINSIKLDKDVNILDLYKKKKELFFKSKEYIFNLLKEKMLIDQENDKFIKNYGKKNVVDNSQFEFLNIVTPPLELEVNFDQLLKQDYPLVKYQVHNVFSKLRELTLSISKFPIFLLYSLSVNCQSLNSLKIDFIKDENEEKNAKNIEIFNEMCPKLITYLKTLSTFSLNNFPLLPINLPDLSASLKNSKIKKLSLVNCFQSKDDIIQLIPYFSVPNTLLEIDLSNHKFNFPTYLNTSLLNYNISRNLTSINFSNCKLDDQDIKHITNYVVSSTSLLVCDIGKNILSPLSCSTFGYCILKTTSLETLRINECGINGESLLFLFNGKGSKPIKHINLNGNKIEDIGLVSLSAFMKSSPLLESIELEECGGTDMGFQSLVKTIQGSENSKMKYVNFHKNNITKVALDILKKFNDFFKKKKVVFALDKIEGETENIDAIDCAMFT
jgi:chromosome segregation ATPase